MTIRHRTCFVPPFMGVTAICYRCRTSEERESRRPADCDHCGARLILSMSLGAEEREELEETLHRCALRLGTHHKLPGVPHMPRGKNRVATPVRGRGDWVTAASSLAAGAGMAVAMLKLFIG